MSLERTNLLANLTDYAGRIKSWFRFLLGCGFAQDAGKENNFRTFLAADHFVNECALNSRHTALA